MVIIVNLLKLMQPLCKVYTRLLLPQSCKFDSWPVRARGELEHGTCHHLSWIFQYVPRLHDSKSDISRINNVQTVTCIMCWSSSSGFIRLIACQARCFLSLFLPKPNNPTPNPETNPKTERRPNPKHNQIQYQTQSQAQKQTQMFLARGTAIVQVFDYAGRFSAMPLLAYAALQCTQWWSRWMRKAKSFQVCTNTHWLWARTNLFQHPTVIYCDKRHLPHLPIRNLQSMSRNWTYQRVSVFIPLAPPIDKSHSWPAPMHSSYNRRS